MTPALPCAEPPRTVCLLRLSAIGDACHAAAALQALRTAWPAARFTWIIGRLEARLMSALLPDIEFITFDKRAMFSELRRLHRTLAARRFDLLLDLQLSMRASLVSTSVRAPVKLGFDRARARELQWLFTNARIAPAANEHVLDSFMGFVRACGVEPGRPAWRFELPAAARAYATTLVPDARPTLLISPGSSHPHRNWSARHYAAVADHAASVHDMRVILIGGRTAPEARLGAAIASHARTRLVDQVGKDTLPELQALLARATALLTPDSGPAHMATMAGLPVIGLYAATRSARTGPYYSRQWCVDKYDDAARRFLGRPADQVPWATKIEQPGVMDLIGSGDVTRKLDALLARAPDRPNEIA